ncbi:ATP-binding protein [Streptomyces sp. NPDC054933]
MPGRENQGTWTATSNEFSPKPEAVEAAGKADGTRPGSPSTKAAAELPQDTRLPDPCTGNRTAREAPYAKLQPFDGDAEFEAAPSVLRTAAHRAFRSAAPGVETTGFAACALSVDVQAIREARQFIRVALGGWGMAPLIDNVSVVASELLSNAFRYGLPSPRDCTDLPPAIWLSLLCRGETVMCAVADASTEIPVLRTPDYLAESGRGLRVIDSLSESWGWTPPGPSGKAVWAAVSAPAVRHDG